MGLVSLAWVLPPLSNSWIIFIVWLYIALNKTPNIDCYWGGQYPKFGDGPCEVLEESSAGDAWIEASFFDLKI